MQFGEWVAFYTGLFEDLHRAVIAESDDEKGRELLHKNTHRLNKHKRACLIAMLFLEAENLGKKKIFKVIDDFLKSVNFDIEKINLEIYRAVFNGDVETVESYLKSNGELKSSIKNWHLLVNCLFYKKNNVRTRKEMLMLFIQHGLIDLYSKNFKHNLLHRLVLLVDDDDPNALEIAEILIKHGTSIHARDRVRCSPLDCSILKQSVRLVTFFLEKGAKINQLNHEGPPVFQAVKFCKNKDILEHLLSKGANINRKNDEGDTPLHEACLQNKEEFIRLLLRRGANISTMSYYEETPLFILKVFDPNDYITDTDVIEGAYKSHFMTFEWATKEQNDRCIIVMVKEFAKLIFQNKRVLKKDRDLVQEIAREDFEKCTDELKEMTENEFYAPYSFYSVLNESINIKKISQLTGNKELLLKFETKLTRFTYYQDDLRLIWNEADKVREKFDKVVFTLYSIFNDLLPDVVIRKLANNLSIEDLTITSALSAVQTYKF